MNIIGVVNISRGRRVFIIVKFWFVWFFIWHVSHQKNQGEGAQVSASLSFHVIKVEGELK